MIPNSEDEISQKNKRVKNQYYSENILKFFLKEQLKNIFILGKLGNIL